MCAFLQADAPAQAPVAAKTEEEAIARSKNTSAAQKPAVPPLPVQARTQEEAATKAKEAYAAKPKAEAKTGRSFFQRLKPEKVTRCCFGPPPISSCVWLQNMVWACHIWVSMAPESFHKIETMCP